MHTARSAMPTQSPSLSAVEYTATASAPRSWQARTRRTAASPRFAIRTRRSMVLSCNSSSNNGWPYSTGSALPTSTARITPACSDLSSLNSFIASSTHST